MALYTTIHFHNVPEAREPDYAVWFDGPHRAELGRLRGFRGADRFQVTPEQIMIDIAQPWKFCSIYDVETETAEIDIPALAPLIANARDQGMIETASDSERLFTYRIYTDDWEGSPNWQRNKPLSGVSVLLGNYVAGRYEEYMEWYKNVHCPEVTNVPGHVAMKRASLCPVQVEPRRYCPGDQLILTAQQTDNLAFTVRDFGFRATGRSPSGIAMKPRSKAGSFARTVHYFRKISGTAFWPGGIAYAGDLSVYPDGYGHEAS